MPSFLDDLVEHSAASHTEESLEYLYKRGAEPEQIEALQVGFCPGPFQIPPTTEDHKRFLKTFHGGRNLAGKIIFPLRSPQGTVTAISVRGPKEKNYMRFTLARGKAEGVFFGLDQAFPTIWEDQTVTVCEGVFDYFPLARVFPDCVCVLSAVWSRAQMRFFHRYIKAMKVAFDMDQVGREATQKLITFHASKFDIRSVSYPGKDPGDLWYDLGEDAFQRYFREEKSWLEV
jgi:DNA primase